ncbi:YncE family protein [Streptomyces spectabilis]|uniref:DNA-binding beta-propeller fold protein YncE n=1 Tax=Streptomyces spectabilis TaxID=68270 RepID=A0A5P2XD70_STRST|nr:YncE family protein [Streptomyces spectabilis]MBB5103770.1 DNA-binding beta-propeller fold protein YncE [Streptomyces spectabilis]MCI3903990.1 YncE family protein [Streptomyces spectabilis]QEV61135.1 YncE family protein [Streptomyces spectabilis]GGV18884.1 putative surface layer protein [Streptomyces spectabilis]
MQQPDRQSARAGREGDVLAVVSQSGPTVSFFDAATDRHLGAVDVLAEPHELCFDPTRRLLWCASTYSSGYYHDNAGRRTELTVIDPDARRVVDVVDIAPEHGPHGLALDAARGRLYVSVEGSGDRPGGVVVIDTESRKPLGRIDTDAPGPHWFAIDPAGTIGYATNKEAPFVSVVDLERGVLTAKVEVPGSEGLAVSADGTHAFVAAPYGSFSPPRAADGSVGAAPVPGIRVVDAATASVTEVLPTENTVFPVHLTSTGLLLAGELRMETDPGSRLGRQAPGRLLVYSADTREAIGEVEVGRFPLTITSSPDGGLAYVSGVVSSTVDVIDLEILRSLARLDIARSGEPGAHGLAYVPRPT